MHKTAFHTTFGDILFFPQWVLTGRKETYLSCILIAVLGILFQGIKFARQQYGRKCRNRSCKRYILNKGHILQTLLYLVQFVWGYALMLAVMTYNLWIMVAAMLGFGLGYLFFGWGEYEERSSMLHVSLAGVSGRAFSERRACGIHGDGSDGKDVLQELMPVSDHSGSELIERDIGGGDSVRCRCGESKI